MENKSSTHDRELLISRTLNAPVELVWEVWTKPEHIAQWWGPDGFTNTINTMNVEPEGIWEFIMHSPNGANFKNRSIFKEVVPFKKIVYEHVVHPWIRATITFEERGEQTHLTWHMLFESAEEFIKVIKAHNAAEGQKQNVVKLAAYLEGLKNK
ncbi:SRPBCC family protein [Mucilaginibacter sp.]|uniref:SRPBCC family protein n=1 Tax=Mucilaginibacter sp. TaxID=1882438 RepID=UPI0025E088F7|nr:SRPBCC family protein [Mucilaginibacter sp.]